MVSTEFSLCGLSVSSKTGIKSLLVTTFGSHRNGKLLTFNIE